MINPVRCLIFVDALTKMAAKHPGLSIQSFGRSPLHNKQVGGVPNSQHLDWTAGDGTWDKGTEPDLMTVKLDAATLGLDAIKEAAHWHFELGPRIVPART